MSIEERDIQELIPHRPPLVLIDRLTACAEDRGEAVRTFRRGDYGVVDGMVPESLLIEGLAQTAAAMQGYQRLQSALPAGGGMLVGLDRVRFLERVAVDQELRLSVQLVTRVGPFRIIAGRVHCGGRLVAEGEFKVLIQGGEDGDQAGTVAAGPIS
jgi:3-hydroxymyristoyl/3-hydroxydecanoyl-(acyl carrier protein) dehydratase